MQDSIEETESKQEVAHSPVRELLTEQIRQQLSDQLSDTHTEILTEEQKLELEEQVQDKILSDPSFQTAVTNLEDAVEQQVSEAGDQTVHDILESLVPKVGSVLNAYFENNSQTIWELAVKGTAELLSYDQVQQLLQDKAVDLVYTLANNFVTGKDPKAYSALSYLGSVVIAAAGEESWFNVVNPILMAMSLVKPVAEAGFNIVGALLTKVNLGGTSGKPRSVETHEWGGHYYVGVTISGLGLYFAVNPGLDHPPVIFSTGKLIPAAASKALKTLKFVPGFLSGVAKTIIAEVNASAVRKEAEEFAMRKYGTQLLGELAETTVRELISSMYDWVAGLYGKHFNSSSESPNGPQITPEPTSPVWDELAESDPPPVPMTESLVEVSPGSRYAYLIVSSDEK